MPVSTYEMYRRPHTIFQAEGYQDTVLYKNRLYTADGKLIPDEVGPTQLERVHIPAGFRHLAQLHMIPQDQGANPFAGAEQPLAASQFGSIPTQTEFEFSPSEIAEAINLLRQMRGQKVAEQVVHSTVPLQLPGLDLAPVNPASLVPPIPEFPLGEIPDQDTINRINHVDPLPLQPRTEFETVKSRGIIEKRPKGKEKQRVVLGKQ